MFGAVNGRCSCGLKDAPIKKIWADSHRPSLMRTGASVVFHCGIGVWPTTSEPSLNTQTHRSGSVTRCATPVGRDKLDSQDATREWALVCDNKMVIARRHALSHLRSLNERSKVVCGKVVSVDSGS